MANLKRTREDILKSIVSTVHRQGLTATGLSKLFEVSGASSGSFYNYFQSKHELGHALIDFEWSQLQADVLEPAISHSEDPIKQVFWILDRLEEKQMKAPKCGGCLLGNLIVDLVEQDPSFRDHLMQVFSKWEGAIAQTLRQAKPQLRDDINPEHLAEQIITAIEGAMLMSKLHRNQARLKRGFNIARQALKNAL
ncbi:TetR/AcrR family transcriptional regulator [Leptolyngbyaceae cyanobacterium CCMR0082]|uniref:TetR/AcrR family transcriptional regulator n=2 Tax=Adonisia turfae TaxID=2950184 RepID=A0A6M0SH89_9CYAN|nr:TetR/AcrR family transcriptional regulator [Adonisia turfae]MDV3348165.1 TetR family transcriptional regulator C-terminal domain-containing protein [Leptothoe sp. LEGE 181152]NEZ60837.1 TetR/AcrR family transcriptional regulator [Adonisia turfae CCMR0081]NEZ67855.1 TetR/AcrR family transcriptional regulator [Adonisia turfae CCMR0082]